LWEQRLHEAASIDIPFIAAAGANRFRIVTPTAAAVRKQRRSNKKAHLAYMLSSGVLQSIMQNISALDVS